jgi:hypothetical protein
MSFCVAVGTLILLIVAERPISKTCLLSDVGRCENGGKRTKWNYISVHVIVDMCLGECT